MKKVISFSLWADNYHHTAGAFRNVELANFFYPDFECWFYIHKDIVPNDIIENLSSFKNVKVIVKDCDIKTAKPFRWRFEPLDDPDVEILLPRCTDCRILLREKLAVDEWLKSEKMFHIMRDHPRYKTKMLCGMFGVRKMLGMDWNKWKNIFEFEPLISTQYVNDQLFIETQIYPRIKDHAFIHASFNKYESHAKDFPIPYDSDYHCGGVYFQ
jgi:hypothetical protein